MSKFIASSEALRRGLLPLLRTVNKTTCLPILEDVRIQSMFSQVFLTTTDLESTLTVRLDAEVRDPFEVCVPADRLWALVSACDEQPLTLQLVGGDAFQVIGDNFSLKLPTDDPANFPKEKVFEEPRILLLNRKVEDFARALDAATRFVSHDDLRPAMTGVKFELKPEGVRLVATDAHRLFWKTIEAPHGAALGEGILPLKAATTLVHLLKGYKDELKMEFDQTHVRFHVGRYLLTVRLIDARYPDYERVLPHPHSLVNFYLKRREAAAFVKMAGRFAHKTTSKVRLQVCAKTGTIDAVAEDLDCSQRLDYRLRAYEFSDHLQSGFGINVRFLSEAIARSKDELVKISWSGAPTKPIVVDDNILIMPLMDND